eukprot:11189912-Lingulodinium_polyedra.AAC.1
MREHRHGYDWGRDCGEPLCRGRVPGRFLPTPGPRKAAPSSTPWRRRMTHGQRRGARRLQL